MKTMTNEKQLAKIMYFSREIERILQEKFEVKGRGLHTYLDAIESELDRALLQNLRYLATIRNKSIHENLFEIDNFMGYESIAKESIIRLNNIIIPKKIMIVRMHTKRMNQRTDTKSILRDNMRYIVIVMLLLLMLVNGKFILLVWSDISNTNHQNIKEEVHEIRMEKNKKYD